MCIVLNHTREVVRWLQWLRDHNATVSAAERVVLADMDVPRLDVDKRIALGHLADPAEAPGRREAAASARALADHVDLVLAEDYRSTRENLMLGHNGHVAKQGSGVLGDTVGRMAAEAWGEDYRVIGTDYVESRFLSGSSAQRGEFRLTNRTPRGGMFAGTDVGYLEIAATTDGNRELFVRVTPMGSTGEGFTRLQEWVPLFNRIFVVPAELYDAVILVNRTGPVTML